MTIGTYALVKNEAIFIREHIKSFIPFINQAVFFDGDSTDGTVDIIKEEMKGPHGHKIKLFEHKDPKNLEGDYEKLFNECMWSLDTDFALFAHPDMILDSRSVIKELGPNCISASCYLNSFSGEVGGDIYQTFGRDDKWKNIYRLRNPNIGAHYVGAYGAQNEDTYFSEITGNEHKFHGKHFDRYPYIVEESGILLNHYSDIRPYARRYDRMYKCLLHQGFTKEEADIVAKQHPRVTLKDGMGFKFQLIETPEFLKSKRPEEVVNDILYRPHISA